MYTDQPPQGKDRAEFSESDRINTLDLPQDVRLLPEIAKNIEAAMQTGKTRRFELLVRSSFHMPLASIKSQSAASGCSKRDHLKAASG